MTVPIAEQFSEWQQVSANEPLRQGDILRALQPGEDLWSQWLIVITADCDLAHSKHDGALSVVSVLHHRDYLQTFRSERVCSTIEKRLLDGLMDATSREVETPEGNYPRPRVSRNRMSEWVMEVEHDVIASTLKVEGPDLTRLTNHALAYRTLRDARAAGDIGTVVRAAADAKLVLGEAKSVERARHAISGQFAESLVRPPGDAMYLNAVAEGAAEGYVVYLRRIHEVNESRVLTSTRLASHEGGYLRTSRLGPPFIYALTQRLGDVFSSIGLPSEYEQQREETTTLFTLLLAEES